MNSCKHCGKDVVGAGQKKYCDKRCKEAARYIKHRETRLADVLEYEWAKTPELYCWTAARNRCRTSGLDFTISVSDIPPMEKYCPVTGSEMSRNEGGHKHNSPTLDRIDNREGYVPGNVRIISFRANRCKSDMTPDIIKNLYRYSIGEI